MRLAKTNSSICNQLMTHLSRLVLVALNKNQKCVPLRAMKTFIREKMDHTT